MDIGLALDFALLAGSLWAVISSAWKRNGPAAIWAAIALLLIFRILLGKLS